MSPDETRRAVKEFIFNRFMIGRPADFLKDTDPMLEKGVMDSTGVLELVGFLEERFGFTVEDEELVPEHLGSVDNIVAFVLRKAGLAR